MKHLRNLEEIIRSASDFDWTLQGFGMFRLYLSENVRLHLWDSDFAVPEVSTIHTHPWDFWSEVLVGEIRDVTFTFTPDAEDTRVFGAHKKRRIVCGEGGGLCEDSPVVGGTLTVVEDRTYFPGDRYHHIAPEIHDSHPKDGTVTVVSRIFHADTEHADVFWPAEREWVSAEPRPATSDEVNAAASKALKHFVRRREVLARTAAS